MEDIIGMAVAIMVAVGGLVILASIAVVTAGVTPSTAVVLVASAICVGMAGRAVVAHPNTSDN